ncbi:MAG: hypothetical protein MK135_10950, partial [Polyangiaceae bacterium]|nr:hypothetical protein [Polyangiaceae bacterium]
LASLGVIAVYLAEIYEELKNRPIYLYRSPDVERDQNASFAATASQSEAASTVLASPPSAPDISVMPGDASQDTSTSSNS